MRALEPLLHELTAAVRRRAALIDAGEAVPEELAARIRQLVDDIKAAEAGR